VDLVYLTEECKANEEVGSVEEEKVVSKKVLVVRYERVEEVVTTRNMEEEVVKMVEVVVESEENVAKSKWSESEYEV
jgi:hypothetical protein